MQRLTVGQRYKGDPFAKYRVTYAKSDPVHVPPAGEPVKKQTPPPAQKPLRARETPLSPQYPDKPLFSLFGRGVYADDLLLLVLLVILIREESDPSLLAAIIYLLMPD